MIQSPRELNRAELVKELAEKAIGVARGGAADAKERYHGETQDASSRLESAIEGEIDDLFDHPDVTDEEFEFECLKADVLVTASKEMN